MKGDKTYIIEKMQKYEPCYWKNMKREFQNMNSNQ